MFAVHVNTKWLPEVYEMKRAADENSGIGEKNTKLVYVNLDEMTINTLVDEHAASPHFVIIPISWWEGHVVDGSNLICEGPVQADKREKISAYLDSQVIAPCGTAGKSCSQTAALSWVCS